MFNIKICGQKFKHFKQDIVLLLYIPVVYKAASIKIITIDAYM